MNNKIAFGILIVAAVIFSVGIWWYFANLPVTNNSVSSFQGQSQVQNSQAQQSNQSQTAVTQTTGWQTYTNQQENFSIQYPSNWQMEHPMTPGGVAFNAFFFCAITDQGCGGDNAVYLLNYNLKQPNNQKNTQYLGFDTDSKLYFYLSDLPTTDMNIYNKMISTFKFIQ